MIISEGLEKFLYNPEINRNNQFIFVINPVDSIDKESQNDFKSNKETLYLRSIIKKIASAEKLRFGVADNEKKIIIDSVYNLFILKSIIMQTRYNGFAKNKFLGEKTINRSINVKISVDIASSDDNMKFLNFIESNYKDEFNIEDYENIESSEYEFTQAIPPEISEFESIIFPALLVLVSAGTTLLFFIIRTK